MALLSATLRGLSKRFRSSVAIRCQKPRKKRLGLCARPTFRGKIKGCKINGGRDSLFRAVIALRLAYGSCLIVCYLAVDCLQSRKTIADICGQYTIVRHAERNWIVTVNRIACDLHMKPLFIDQNRNIWRATAHGQLIMSLTTCSPHPLDIASPSCTLTKLQPPGSLLSIWTIVAPAGTSSTSNAAAISSRSCQCYASPQKATALPINRIDDRVPKQEEMQGLRRFGERNKR